MRISVLVAALVAAVPSVAGAVKAPHVDVDLVADVASIAPGRDVGVGPRFELERGWHVYWQNPGDSGEAPRLTWSLPAGFSGTDLSWPAPHRIPVGPLANFGYEGTVVLPATVHVPRDVTGSVDLRADVHWLVCNEDACIPGHAPLSLVLPVEPTARPSAEAPLFAAARAALPVAAPSTWRPSVTADGGTLALIIDGYDGALDPPPAFFPFSREAIEHAAPQPATRTSTGIRLTLVRAPSNPPLGALGGVLAVGGHAYTIAAPLAGSVISFDPKPLALAFAGGLLLNLMPCVFPVLAIKAFALLGLGAHDRRVARAHGLAYTAGVLVAFWALAVALLVVRAGGAPLGWGFQLQSPVVVAALAALFFWLALMLLDVTSFGGALMGIGNELATAGGARGAFFTGLLATVVATPCSAPFMGAALGYALVAPPAVALGVFTALGLGLAVPYLAITLVPSLGARLPRPGRWMDVVKQLLAFPLLATVVWLVWVASLQSGPPGVAAMLAMLVLLAFAAWVGRQWSGRVARVAVAAAVVAAVVLGGSIERADAPPTTSAAGWERYSSARLAELLGARRPVFVDFTAAWCVTCQVNERLVLAQPRVRERMRALGVVPVRADWTTPDPDVTRALQQFGRDGVPLYVLYSGRADEPPRILPQVLTTDTVISELDQLDRRSPT